MLVTSWKACVQCQCPQKRADAETMFGQRAKHCLHRYLDCELSQSCCNRSCRCRRSCILNDCASRWDRNARGFRGSGCPDDQMVTSFPCKWSWLRCQAPPTPTLPWPTRAVPLSSGGIQANVFGCLLEAPFLDAKPLLILMLQRPEPLKPPHPSPPKITP